MDAILLNSASRLAEMIRSKDVSPVEVVEAHIHRIEEVNPRLNAFVTTTFEAARAQARQAEEAIAKREGLGPLHGVPISIKDTIDTDGVRTVGGTRLRETFVPDADAPVVARLKKAGAILMGKTNVPECAMDYRAENPVFGRTSNPWDLARVPGGSSGGEAAAIASGCTAAGIGSDLGGSIRVPAHFCGITGLKPTPGRIPGAGHFPPGIGPFSIGASLGPMARRVEDLALMLKVLAGFEPSDPASVPIPYRSPDQNKDRPLERFRRVMFYSDDGISPVTPETRSAVERAARALGDMGYEVEERRPAGIENSHELWMNWLARVGLPGVAGMYAGREDLMGPLIQALMATEGSRVPTLDVFISAWVARDMLRISVVREMTKCPIILAPVAAVPAFEHDHRGGFQIDGEQVDYLKAFSYSQTYNLLGLPAVVVPVGKSPEGLPIGVQIVGRPFEEEDTLVTAALLEEAFGEYQPPPI